MRLLLVVDSLDIGGAERHVVDLANALRDRGHEVTVACSASGPLAIDLEDAGIPVLVLAPAAIKRRVSLLYAWRLRALLREQQFDLVHAHVYASIVAAALATLGSTIPLVLTAHTEGAWQGPGAQWVARQSYRRAARIIAVSDRIACHVMGHGVSADRMMVIPNAVTPARTEKLGVIPLMSANGPLVGVIARLQPEKGIDVFLQAARSLISWRPEVQFVIIGDGFQRQSLLSRSRLLGLEGNVQFLGAWFNARGLLSALDVLVVPSFTEGSPLVVLEAMAAGIPIVATAVGSIPDQIRHGREGLLTQPGDALALAECIGRLLRNPALARRLGGAAHARSISHFSHEMMIKRTEESYRAALDQRVQRASGLSRMRQNYLLGG